MPGNMSYISILNWGSEGPSGATSSFSGVAGITFSTTGGTVLASAAGGGGAALTFSNGNGVTFGEAGSVVTASVATNYQSPGAYLTTAAVVAHSHGAPTLALTNASATASSASNGLTLSISVQPPGTGGSGISQIAAGTEIASTGGVTFSNSNGVSFGLNAGVLTATVRTDYQSAGAYLTTAAPSGHSHGAGSLALTNLSGTASSASGGWTLSLSGPAGGTGGGGVAAAAGSQTQTAGTAVFSNNSLISFGMSNSSVITASMVMSQITAGANITLSSSGSTISIIGAAGGTGAGAAISASGSSQNSGTVVFSNSNYLSWGMSGSVVTGSVAMSQLEAGTNITLSTSGSTVSIIGPPTTVLEAGANITLSVSGSTVSIIGPSPGTAGAGVALGAGTQTATSGTVVFSNANGVSFGQNAGTVTASVFTNYQSTGAYLTTAALSADSSKYAGTATGATNANVTVNTSGVSVSVLNQTSNLVATGYATSNITGNSSGTFNLSSVLLRGIDQLSVGFSNGSILFEHGGADPLFNRVAASNSTVPAGSTVLFSNSNNVSFGVTNGSQMTASASYPTQSVQPVAVSASNGSYNFSTLKFVEGSGVTWATQANGIQASVKTDYLTTAALSGDTSKYAGTSTGVAGASVTLNTAGISLSLPAYLTTADLSQNSSKYAGTSTGFAGGSVTLNTAGISVSLPAYLTTAMASNAGPWAGTVTGATGGSITVNTSGVSLSLPAYLTTAALSANTSNYAGTSTGIAGGSVTLNTAGISVSLPAYLTTAAQTGHSHGNPTLALTNLTGTTASASNGFTLSLSAAAPGGAGDGYNVIAVSNSTAGASTTVLFSNSGGVSWGLNGGTITATVATNYQSQGAYLTTAALVSHSHGNPTLYLTNITGTTASASNGLSLSLSAAAPGGGGGRTYSFYQPYDEAIRVTGQAGQSTLMLFPVQAPPVTFDRVVMPVNYTNASDSSNSFFVSMYIGIYTKNGATLGTLMTTSHQYSTTNSGTVGAMTNWLGVRQLTIPWSTSFDASNYWIGVLSRTTTTGGAGMSMSQFMASQIASVNSGPLGAAPVNSNQIWPGLGIFSAQTAALPDTIGFSDIRGTASVQIRPPIVGFALGTV